MDIAPTPLAQVPIEVALEVVLVDALAGRLCELSGEGATCPASVAFLLVREAQRRGVLAAWLQVGWRRQSTGTARTTTRPPDAAPFFAPDLIALGLDLATLPFIPVQDMNEAGRAATHLLRSGAFALLVIDTLSPGDGGASLPDARRTRHTRTARTAGNDTPHPEAEIPLPLMSRLVGLAQKHHAALIVLTTKPAHSPSLGSLVSFHAHVALARDRTGDVANGADAADREVDGFTHLTCRLVVEKDKRRGPGLTLTQTFRAPPGLR